MDPYLRTKWTTALRSGEYKQGKITLKDYDEKYCCLGVLACVGGLYSSDRNLFIKQGYSFCRKEITNEEHMRTLMCMNDGTSEFAKKSLTFKEIADWIEKNL